MIQRMFVTIDTKKTNYKNVGKINHGDDLILELTVLSDGDMISFNDPMVDLLVKKSDGKMVRQNSGIEHIKPNKFVIEVSKDCVTSPGLSTNQLVINDNGRISTCMFYYTILNSLEEDIIESISNVEVLEQLDEFVIQIQDKMEIFDDELLNKISNFEDAIEDLEEFFGETSTELLEAELSRNEAEQSRAQAESVRVQNETRRLQNDLDLANAEAERVRAENIRIQNEVDRALVDAVMDQKESEREDSELERIENESKRATDEVARQQNENTRQFNETDRKTQENRRVTAETNRVNAETTRRNNENSRISNENERQKTIKEMKSLIDDVHGFDERVGVIEDEIEEINSSLDNLESEVNELKEGDIQIDLTNYATKDYIDEAINNAKLEGGNTQVDLSAYAKKTDLHDHSNKTILDSITTSKVNQWDNKSDFSGNYNDLTNKPAMPTKTSQLTNDSGYITSIPNEYVTEINNINTSLGNITTEIQSILVRLNNLENATPPSIIYGGIVLSKTATTIIEGGSESFAVTLDKAPSNNQIVTISKTNPDVSLSTTTLTFTPTNYNVSQIVTITVSEDTDTKNDTDIITLTSPNVTDKTVSVTIADNDSEAIDTPIDEVSMFVGNRYEPHPQNFLKGYKYILTPQTSCTWNNPTTVTTIDLTQEVPTENSKYGGDKQLKGYFKVTTMKNEEIISTPTTFVSTSTPRWYGAVVKRNGKDNVVILGDSLSEQAFVTFKFNYVSQLINKYNSKYNLCTQWAKYGETTDLQLGSITKYVNVHINPNDYGFGVDITLDDTKYVSIFTGTNEINNNVDLSTFETNYSALVDYIKTNLPQAKILCITPYLCCKKASNINYINKIKEIAATKGCSVCDLSTFTELDSVSNGQGSYYLEAECIHLNEAGWNLVNPKIIQAYESLDGFTS